MKLPRLLALAAGLSLAASAVAAHGWTYWPGHHHHPHDHDHVADRDIRVVYHDLEAERECAEAIRKDIFPLPPGCTKRPDIPKLSAENSWIWLLMQPAAHLKRLREIGFLRWAYMPPTWVGISGPAEDERDGRLTKPCIAKLRFQDCPVDPTRKAIGEKPPRLGESMLRGIELAQDLDRLNSKSGVRSALEWPGPETKRPKMVDENETYRALCTALFDEKSCPAEMPKVDMREIVARFLRDSAS